MLTTSNSTIFRLGGVMLLLAAAFPADSERREASQTAVNAGVPDPQIAAAVKGISPDEVQSNIEKLVSFRTRLTLSAQDEASIAAGHGIGAARKWIESQFERYSKDCGDCLEVKTDSFRQ